MVIFSFQVEREILQVGIKRAVKKWGNSASVWKFSCTGEGLECELHSAEICRVYPSFKDRTREKMGSLGIQSGPRQEPDGSGMLGNLGKV